VLPVSYILVASLLGFTLLAYPGLDLGERDQGIRPGAIYKTEIESTDFIEAFASLYNHEKLVGIIAIIRNGVGRNCHNLNLLLFICGFTFCILVA
jgi:hypothetical protein